MRFSACVVREGFREDEEDSHHLVSTNFAHLRIISLLFLSIIHPQPLTPSNWAPQWSLGTSAIPCFCTHMHFSLPSILLLPSYHKVFLNSGSFPFKLSQNFWPLPPLLAFPGSPQSLTFPNLVSYPKTSHSLFYWLLNVKKGVSGTQNLRACIVKFSVYYKWIWNPLCIFLYFIYVCI